MLMRSYGLGIAIGMTLLLALAWMLWLRPWLPSYQAATTDGVFAIVEGRWAWEGARSGCDDNAHSIEISPDHRVMTITYDQPWTDSIGTARNLAQYDIEKHGGGFIRAQIRGENRRSRAGTPVVWELVLMSPHRYKWHRTDWVPGSYTAALVRCDSLP